MGTWGGLELFDRINADGFDSNLLKRELVFGLA
jgi:hypothetical protein